MKNSEGTKIIKTNKEETTKKNKTGNRERRMKKTTSKNSSYENTIMTDLTSQTSMVWINKIIVVPCEMKVMREFWEKKTSYTYKQHYVVCKWSLIEGNLSHKEG